MSLTPDFEIGLWNAWILMLPHVLTYPVFFVLAKQKAAPTPSEGGLSRPMMAFCAFSKLIEFPALAYSFFLPLKVGTMWFYVGLPITLLGFAAYIVVLVNWSHTPAGEPVTTGLYHYSRHPMYVTGFIFLFGVSLASASWVLLLVTAIEIVGAIVFIDFEERGCLGLHGEIYRDYMNRTPRWLGIPKSEKD
jgi:protein-S-isoprenylcysteine O-methyltransferase Ste14